MKRTLCAALGATMLLAGCASSYEPVVDMQGDDQARYDADLKDCRAYGEKVDPVKNAAGGAVAGAVFGAIIGGILLGGRGAALGASLGATEGGTGAGAGSVVHQRAIIINCMVGRGHKVLG